MSSEPIHEGPANLQSGIETVGGKLLLYEDRVEFVPHFVNMQRTATSIPLSSLLGISFGWTKFLDLIPLLPNALLLHTEGELYRLSVFDRKEWQEKRIVPG